MPAIAGKASTGICMLLSRDRHYLQAPQIVAIFAAFICVALPLTFIQLSPAFPAQLGRYLNLGYLLLLGNTHFAITWFLYLNNENWDYFRSSPTNRLIYFMVPGLLMLGFLILGYYTLPTPGTRFAVWFFVVLGAADYYHVVRQSFGVFQLFKGRAAGAHFAPYQTRAANYYFLVLWGLQIITFINGVERGFAGEFELKGPLVWFLCLSALLLFGVMLFGLLQAWLGYPAERQAILVALAYLILQSASSLLVVYRSRLYIPSLAMHYMEYHVLMAPRCFQTELNPKRKLDRWGARLRQNKLLFYALLVGVAACIPGATLADFLGVEFSRDDSRYGWFLVNLLSGIFFAHYFVEAFLWKFRNPFYRQRLSALYLPSPRAK